MRTTRSTRSHSSASRPAPEAAPFVVASLLAEPATPATSARGASAPASSTQATAQPALAAAPQPQAPAHDVPGFTSGTTGEVVPVDHGGHTYRVRTGDSAFSIAGKHGVSVPALIELNQLGPSARVRPGQILSLPEKHNQAQPAGHRVMPGDTLAGIAAAKRLSVAALQRANALGDSVLIRVGEVLALTGTGATSTRAQVNPPADLPLLPTSVGGAAYPPAVLQAARINKYILSQRPHPERHKVQDLIRSLALDAQVPAALALAVAEQESAFQQTMVSPVNAVGVMQVTPAAGRWASTLYGRRLDIRDTRDNVTAGLAILGWLLAHADSEAEAVAGYYQGLDSVRDNGRYPDTAAFVRSVAVLTQRYGGLP